MKISIIGAGNIGGSTAIGLAQSGIISPSEICISNPSQGKLENIRKQFPTIHTTNSNIECVQGADIVIYAVKPWKIAEVISETTAALAESKPIIISLAAGISLADLRSFVKNAVPVFIAIPNTAIAQRQSMTFITHDGASEEQQTMVINLFKALGDTLLVEERLMGAGMALASCGIAYAMRYIRAAMEGGVQLGMYPKDAQRIVQQTLRGAISVLEASQDHPEAQIDRVTTPGGFTIKGLNAMEENGFSNAVIQGLLASVKK